ncbi:hypothetical protein F441_20429 [Phytophthora nicotianae CJ01A1]|uniref:Uncharacterized protein n=2 Tax=Phytophthora nicotianae TaxID=4792 RepID=V9E173_PHYNI|nr:hypothetical protein F443_20547 [Phytophthora nicotianae P1569]ETP02519.1 hypothetical protein F441_20429 [Phytophthora nicotianae CJ01A1]
MENHMQTINLQGAQRKIVELMGNLCASNQSMFSVCASAPLFVFQLDSSESYQNDFFLFSCIPLLL